MLPSEIQNVYLCSVIHYYSAAWHKRWHKYVGKLGQYI